MARIKVQGTFGYTGDDIIVGTAGNDTISGWTGSDVMTGGAGNDLFHFRRGDSGGGGMERDVIRDFDTNGNDWLVFEGISPKEVTYKQVAAGVLVEYTGLGSSVGPDGPQEILLQGQVLSNIGADDFVFI